MSDTPNILAVIPARGGSKGVPGKNIRPLAGQPLIQYTIKTAQQSTLITQLIVSTDSSDIAAVAKVAGATVPFVRPEEHATDTALAIDVMKHALHSMEAVHGVTYDYVVMLQPTTPLKSVEDIDGSIRLLINTGCDAVVTMVDVGANHPARMYTMDDSGALSSVMDEEVTMRRRQELPPVYIRSGAVYACTRDTMFTYNAMMGKDNRGYIMPEDRSVNIDNRADFWLAEQYVQGGVPQS